jgi:hypothetical protein
MRIHRNLLWFAFILGSIFFWYIFFMHGASPRNFWFGIRQELSEGFAWLADRIERKGAINTREATSEPQPSQNQ